MNISDVNTLYWRSAIDWMREPLRKLQSCSGFSLWV